MSKNIFEEAAISVATGKDEFSCNAVSHKLGFDAKEFYAKAMSPGNGNIGIDDVEYTATEELPLEITKTYRKKVRKLCRDFRVLLILFAGELLEGEMEDGKI